MRLRAKFVILFLVIGLFPLLLFGISHFYELRVFLGEEKSEYLSIYASNFLKLFFLNVALVLFVALIFGQKITEVIRDLLKGTREIRSGNFDYKIKIFSEDELSDLADEFNKMTLHLKEYREKTETFDREVEKMAKERTIKIEKRESDLQRTIKELENTRFALLNLGEDLEEARERLKKTNKDLAESIRVQRAFVSHTAHELRSPLNAFRWMIEMLQSEEMGRLTLKTKNLLNQSSQLNKRLLLLVDNLSTLARLDEARFKISISSCNLSDLIDQVAGELAFGLREKSLNLIWKKPKIVMPKIKADCHRVVEVLTNLVGNAIKFTPHGGKISIDVLKTDEIAPVRVMKKQKIVQKDKSYLLCKISDTGLGIPKAEQEKIFSRFFRASNAQKAQIEGTGLGLSIVKQIIDLLYGAIWFESAGEEKGATFYFTLPVVS